MHQPERIRGPARAHWLTEHLHRLGPRAVGELLIEVAAGRDLLETLEEYSRLGPHAVARLDGRDWPVQVWGLSA